MQSNQKEKKGEWVGCWGAGGEGARRIKDDWGRIEEDKKHKISKSDHDYKPNKRYREI